MGKRQSHKHEFAKRCMRWETAGMAFALVLYFAVSAHANVIFGRVYDENNKPKQGVTFTIKEKKDASEQVVTTVTTDNDGNYNIFLPKPGIYIAEFPAGKEVRILSQPEPVRQDIHLR